MVVPRIGFVPMSGCSLIAFFLLQGVTALRLVSLDVPQSVMPGSTVRLACSYDLQGDVLYSVKWYRDDVEFFRFVPSDRPQGQFFPIPGVKVDLRRSSNGTVYMTDVDSSTAGTFRCDISADAPSFQTVAAETFMNVKADMPSHALQATPTELLLWLCIWLLPCSTVHHFC